MTPAARYAAAITILDDILGGAPAEKALLTWSRGARYAGSGDRAAVRDNVFDVLRMRRSMAVRGGGGNGRALILGLVRHRGEDPNALFTGAAYAPAALTDREASVGAEPDSAEALDLPDWILPEFRRSLGDNLSQVAEALRRRAPVWLRVNLLKSGMDEAAASLASEGITTEPGDLSPTALRVTGGARRLRKSRALLQGLVDLQDAASQAVVDALPLSGVTTALDYCAGGGGKALAMAGRAPGLRIKCHDIDPRRMADLLPRAERAGARLETIATDKLLAARPFELVLADVPCSGTGAWARTPDAKWRLGQKRLDELAKLQGDILDEAAALVTANGVLAYATCSLLTAENESQISGFLQRHPEWSVSFQRRFLPTEGGDGFFTAHLTRSCPET